jgi:Flp pilus assembly protein TadG
MLSQSWRRFLSPRRSAAGAAESAEPDSEARRATARLGAATRPTRGAMSIQLLVILVPAIFGLMGFAFDLGRLFLIRGELHQAANAMALAAASQMTGATSSALDNMNRAANQALNDTNGNRFNFGSTTIPPGTITCFSSLADASTNNTGATTDCGSAQPLFVQATVSVNAPLLFWSLLPGGETRTTTVASYAVAGMSAPLCTGCGIVPLAALAPDTSGADTDNWGFTAGNLYTFYYSCSGAAPAAITGTAVPYVVLNRVNPDLDESDQMFRQGAQGLSGSTTVTTNPSACVAAPSTPISCVNIGDVEQIPISGLATPLACSAATPPTDSANALCGLYMRLDANPPGACQTGVTDFGTISTAYRPDTDLTYLTDASAYVGNGRRILTVPIVNAMPTDTTCGSMTVVAFRQFLLEPNADGTPLNPIDQNSRFVALYLGTAAPVSQGWFDTRYAPACRSYLTTGPGKVVLHQ